jgi:hypothetical protein
MLAVFQKKYWLCFNKNVGCFSTKMLAVFQRKCWLCFIVFQQKRWLNVLFLRQSRGKSFTAARRRRSSPPLESTANERKQMETAKLRHRSQTQKRGKGAEANDEDGEALSGQARGSGSSSLHKFPGGKGLVADPSKGKLTQSTFPEDGNVTLLTYTDRSVPSRFSDLITPNKLRPSSRG